MSVEVLRTASDDGDKQTVLSTKLTHILHQRSGLETAVNNMYNWREENESIYSS